MTQPVTGEDLEELDVKDRQMKVSEKAKALDISEGIIHKILHGV